MGSLRQMEGCGKMKDLIIAASFCGTRMYRTRGLLDFFMDDPCILEIMDAQTGEIYKYTPGISFMNDIDWSRIDVGYEL